MQVDCNKPDDMGRDRFILSKGHAAAAVYATLSHKGFISRSALKKYGEEGSVYMTHVSHKVRGIEFSSGSLGHGLSFGVGKALYAKLTKSKFRTFVLMSDGELNEGSNWEAFMFAAHHELSNLVAIIDYNKLQSLKTVEETLKIEPLTQKLESFGWNVIRVDGHNFTELENAFNLLEKSEKPAVIIADTIKGKGVSFMENKVSWHYTSPTESEYLEALTELS